MVDTASRFRDGYLLPLAPQERKFDAETLCHFFHLPNKFPVTVPRFVGIPHCDKKIVEIDLGLFLHYVSPFSFRSFSRAVLSKISLTRHLTFVRQAASVSLRTRALMILLLGSRRQRRIRATALDLW